jgi:hypothetical protein
MGVPLRVRLSTMHGIGFNPLRGSVDTDYIYLVARLLLAGKNVKRPPLPTPKV